ncbi:zwei Ig domain protein zig-8-like [Lycorma delicatula]|uniref:zwei Ig domain protein zig-8-like n=1 Tax=Lycorma delicatula TaxID=130591 RepID=UPI003F5155DC
MADLNGEQHYLGLITKETTSCYRIGDPVIPDHQLDAVLESQGFWELPYFENSTKREITATVGQPAYLHCRVRNLGDRAVSWMRKRDLHILTVGAQRYTRDSRFQALHQDGSDEWTLRIFSPRLHDSGTYECQVSTEPKISQAFVLDVVVSRAQIVGNKELYVKSGSDINLTCLVLEAGEPPSFIYWYRGADVVNYSGRGGISVLTDRQTRSSQLLISCAQPHDSGNYTCSPSASDAASVMVHVLHGEQPAAMQHGKGNLNKVISPSTSSVSLSSQSSNASSLKYSLQTHSLQLIAFSCHLSLLLTWIFMLKLHNDDTDENETKRFFENISDIT